MSERRVVPGRIFAPSTIHSRNDLLLPMLAILLGTLPAEGDEDVVIHLKRIIGNTSRFPIGDRSLHETATFIRQLSSTLANASAGLKGAVEIMQPSIDFDSAIERLKNIFDDTAAAIECER